MNSPNTKTEFQFPMEISGYENVRTLLPKMEDIPEEFDSHYNKWNKVVSTWFFEGVKKERFKAKEGIDKDKAFTHLSYVLSSWDLKHEHKTTGVAYLMSLWFKDFS